MMKEKSEVHSKFKTFHKMICTQFGAVVKIVRSDNGGEYFKSRLEEYFLEDGMIQDRKSVV